MSVTILDVSAWREFRGKPANAGINETTHLAKIADPTGGLHDCFVKLFPDGPALLCEAIGWTLARTSDVTCPSFAAIIMVPVAELRKCIALPSRFDGMALCPAWCSEVAAGKTVRQVHKMAFFVARKNCLRSKDARKIAAFDKWGDLRDRNFGNVILSAKGGYIAIDHETLLHDLLWVPFGRKYEERCLMAEARKSLSPPDFARFQIDMAAASNGHAKALSDARVDLADIIGRVVATDATRLTAMIEKNLGERAQPGWLADHLKVIA